MSKFFNSKIELHLLKSTEEISYLSYENRTTFAHSMKNGSLDMNINNFKKIAKRHFFKTGFATVDLPNSTAILLFIPDEDNLEGSSEPHIKGESKLSETLFETIQDERNILFKKAIICWKKPNLNNPYNILNRKVINGIVTNYWRDNDSLGTLVFNSYYGVFPTPNKYHMMSLPQNIMEKITDKQAIHFNKICENVGIDILFMPVTEQQTERRLKIEYLKIWKNMTDVYCRCILPNHKCVIQKVYELLEPSKPKGKVVESTPIKISNNNKKRNEIATEEANKAREERVARRQRRALFSVEV